MIVTNKTNSAFYRQFAQRCQRTFRDAIHAFHNTIHAVCMVAVTNVNAVNAAVRTAPESQSAKHLYAQFTPPDPTRIKLSSSQFSRVGVDGVHCELDS